MKCPTCEMLRYQDLACSAEKRFKVRYFLRKSEKWREKISNMSSKQIELLKHFCSPEHQTMARDIWKQEVRLRFQLLEFEQEEIEKERKILAALSFEYAEALILHGFNSDQSYNSRRRLETQKNRIANRRREVTRLAHK